MKSNDTKIATFKEVVLQHLNIPMNEKTEFYTYHDELTGLPNQIMFNHHLDQAMKRAQLNNKSLAVAEVSMEGLENINETFTREVGDKLIQRVAARLMDCVAVEDIIGQFAKDKFQILLNQVDEDELSEVVRCIKAAFKKPFKVEEYQLHFTASLGVRMYLGDGEAMGELIEVS